jgi:SAM-dependent methyltransferase
VRLVEAGRRWHDGSVAIYAKFARFYDEIMGDRTSEVEQLRDYITRYLPTATSLLELGCGTGTLLAGLAADLNVTGIDQSPEMLAIATEKVPGATLVSGDITRFSLGTRFDVVICMFDTLNHVPDFTGWIEVFDRVHEHLVEGGLFIFDVNTIGRLRALSHQPPYVQGFGEHTLIMDITPAEGNVVLWEVKIFQRLEDDLFRLHHEKILELGVPLDVIHSALEMDFDLLNETDTGPEPVSDESDRIYFAYRHRG